MSLVVRAANECDAFAFSLSTLVTFILYTSVLSVRASDAMVPADALGLAAFATVFIAVYFLVRTRFSRKTPVLGAKRGAVVGVMATVVVASAHTCVTFGSAGFIYSL